MKSVFRIIKDSFLHWRAHKPQQTGAALSYYAIFSLVPLFGLIVLLASTLLERASIQAELFNQVASLVGTSSAKFLEATLQNMNSIPNGSATAIIGIIILSIGALGVLQQLQMAINNFFDVPAGTQKGFRAFLIPRLLSLSLVPILALLLVASLLGTTMIDFLPQFLSRTITLDPVWAVIKELLPLILATFVFAYMYRVLPLIRIRWGEAFIGALSTAILFTLGKNVIDFYLSSFAGTAKFGAAGTLVAIMIWVYVSVQMFLFGASIVATYARQYGSLQEK